MFRFFVFYLFIFSSYNLFAITFNTNKLDNYISKYQIQKKIIQNQLSKHAELLSYISNKLQENHLPNNLKFIPLIESNFNKNAVSSANAVGLWQLVKKTAIRYNLKVTNDIDERLSIEKSTNAGINYLNYLYNLFDHNIYLAIASYNCGENRVLKAIKRKPNYSSFEDLNLPNETIDYIYKYKALNVVFNNDSTGHSIDKKEFKNLIDAKPRFLVDFNNKPKSLIVF